MKHKTFELLEIKADDDGKPGWFTALASVFGNVDHVGDRVMPGAFQKTLKKWRESGRPLPVILSHQWENPFATIGKADPRAVIETDRGLLVQGMLDVEGNDTAKQVHKLMKEGLMTGWSFGYTVPDGGESLNEKDGANELTEIDLVEIGPTLKGANPEAQLQAVKSALDEEAPAEETANPVEATVEVTDSTVPVSTETNTAATAEVEEADEPESDVEEKADPLTDEGMQKAITESDEIQALIAAEVERRLEERAKAEPDPEPEPDPIEDLLAQEVETVERAKATAKDPLKDEIDLLRLELAADMPLKRRNH